jgi:uncharacterized protein (TIGR02266 family)
LGGGQARSGYVDVSAREFASRPGRASVEIQIALKFAGEPFVGTSSNIGIGGLFLVTDRRFSVGDRFTLELTLPDHLHPMTVAAEVRWIREADGGPPGLGLRFVNPSIGAMVALYDLLRKADERKMPRRSA